MTTVQGETIHNLAIEGDFDDCQAMVKASFVAEPFLPDGRQLAAVNSINWARIMAQIVYYFYAALLLGAPAIGRSTSRCRRAISAIFLLGTWPAAWGCPLTSW